MQQENFILDNVAKKMRCRVGNESCQNQENMVLNYDIGKTPTWFIRKFALSMRVSQTKDDQAVTSKCRYETNQEVVSLPVSTGVAKVQQMDGPIIDISLLQRCAVLYHKIQSPFSLGCIATYQIPWQNRSYRRVLVSLMLACSIHFKHQFNKMELCCSISC